MSRYLPDPALLALKYINETLIHILNGECLKGGR
jgi:hypothetical protein